MQFRSKKAERAFDELSWMTTRYPGHPVSVVDNILDLTYFDSFVPMLQEHPLPVELFYEVKANLKKRQLAQLQRANVRRIQPGIESLHDGVLSLMKKGVSALQNIQLLKWCLELGIEPLWNLIWGFPGEDPSWYAEMSGLISKLRHLPPPDSVSEIRLDRFSPLFNDVSLGALNKRPFPSYDFVYAELPPEERFRLAYHFTFEYGDGRVVSSYVEDLRREIVQWQNSFSRSAFFSISAGQHMVLCDLRAAQVELTLLDLIDTRLYRICDTAQTTESAHSALADPSISREECAERLSSLAATGSMLKLGSRYLSLAIEMNQHVPHVSALERFRDFLQASNISEDDSITQIRLNTVSTYT
jgi:ribosomal peptide maturation radical SAM protein 1